MKEKEILLKITDLKKYFPVKKTGLFQKEQLYVQANDGISLNIYKGETFGLVGESGCGKSTFGRVLLGLYSKSQGKVDYYGRSVGQLYPRHVQKRIASLTKNRERLVTLERAYLAAIKEEDGQSQKAMAAKKAYDALYLDMVRLFGGWVTAGDGAEVTKAFRNIYQAESALFLKKQEKDHLVLQKQVLQERNTEDKTLQQELAKVEERIGKTEGEIFQKEKEFAHWAAHMEQMKIPYLKDEAFMEKEALRDEGIDLSVLTPKEMRMLRKDLQIIFQDPYSSLNPRMSVEQAIGEGLTAHNLFSKNTHALWTFVNQVLAECGLAPYMLSRYPHQFSGGQRQRIGIARALALRPKFVVCDEAVSALDVSIQAQILNLLQDLKEQIGLTYLFISHDLSVVKYISDRIGVMYLGILVELAPTEELFTAPVHPYTRGLLSAIPTMERKQTWEGVLLEGDVPSSICPPKGCKFHTRCAYATEICGQTAPLWQEIRPEHFVACHHKQDFVMKARGGG